MKSVLVTTLTAAIVASGTIVPASVSQQALPPWVCQILPFMCATRS